MKKALTSVLAMISSVAILSGTALTASADVVIATGEDFVLLNGDFELGRYTYQKYSGDDRTLQYGDVVEFIADYITIDPIERFPYYYNFPDDTSSLSMKYLGTAEEVYADNIKELTVTQALENGCVTFVDADGQTCYWYTSVDLWQTDTGYYQYDFTTPDGFYPSDYQVGDVVRCVMKEGGKSVLLPVTPAPEHVSPDKASTRTDIVIAANDTDFILSNYVRVSYDEYKLYSKTDYMPQYGDIIEAGAVNGSLIILESFPSLYAVLDGGELVFSCLGNVTASDDYAHKEMTVIDVKNGTLILEDAEGTVYNYYSESTLSDKGFSVPEGMSISDYQVGDTLTVAMYISEGYGNYERVFPLTPAPEHTPVKGDVDCNGVVNVMDVILLNRNLMVGAEISEQGMKNALTNTTGIAPQSDDTQRQPDAVDALNILKYIVRLIPEL